MKVHPVPRKRNITLRYDIASVLSQSNALAGRQKKLRRLPHIFAKVLELPFNSDADVSIEETSDSFRFVIPTDDAGNNIRADTVEIYPGVTKIVIRGDNVLDSSLGEFELDLWRFRLPPSTLPGLATADFADGELVVTVPKDPDEEEDDGGDIGETGRLILPSAVRSSLRTADFGDSTFDYCKQYMELQNDYYHYSAANGITISQVYEAATAEEYLENTHGSTVKQSSDQGND